MGPTPVVDLDLAVKVVPLVESTAFLVSPPLDPTATNLDLFVQIARVGSRHACQRSRDQA